MDVVFWINAFIPKDVSGYTKKLPGTGVHSGKTAVPFPKVAKLNPLNLRRQSTGFLTDQRSFSNAISASVRMQSSVSITPSTGAMLQNHRSSGTTEVDMETGAQIGHAVANMRRCRFGTLKTTTSGTTKTYSTELSAAAGDPLVSLAADIDYTGSFELVVDSASNRPLTCKFDGKIDDFPAFEAYVLYLGRTQLLKQALPPSGNTVVDLLGWAKRPFKGQARF